MWSGTLQGSILKSFGERLGAVWALLGAFLAFLARSGALLGCLLGFMGASDLILGGFGEGLGGIWRGFGEGFAKVLEDFGKIYFDFLHWDPRAVSLRPAERHNLPNKSNFTDYLDALDDREGRELESQTNRVHNDIFFTLLKHYHLANTLTKLMKI